MEQSHMPVRPRPSPVSVDSLRPHPANPDTSLDSQHNIATDAVASSIQRPGLSPLPLRPPPEPITATELAPIQPSHVKTSSASNHTLPSLSSVTGGLQSTPEPRPAPTQWPSLNPYTVFYSPGYAQPSEKPSRPDADMTTSSPEHCYERRSGSVSLDDPDVRMAAEALGDLRADFISSSPNRPTPLPTPPRDHNMTHSPPPNGGNDQPQAEPLLSLITASHPLLATTIEGATSAYNQGKNFSPHIKTGAEYVEGYLTPVAKAVNNIGQKTGVHTGVRWFLGGSRRHGRKHQSTNDIETGGIHKRRKARQSELSEMDKQMMERQAPELPSYISDRRISVSTIDTLDTLPAYDDVRSPAYSEAVDPASSQTPLEWKAKLVVSTSSLGVALRADSLRNLHYCLRGLRLANAYLGNRLACLQETIDEYDAGKSARDGDDHTMTDSNDAFQDRNGLVARINSLKNDIVGQIGRAIKLVSDYAGSALPDNARKLIHAQLLSLPGRLLRLSREAPTGLKSGSEQEPSVLEGANRVMLLAKEGLQVITQVSDVIDRTIKSAEEWCVMFGKDTGSQAASPQPAGAPEKAPATAQWAAAQAQFSPPITDENHEMADRS